MAIASSENSNVLGLRFDSQQDALDFADQSVQDSKNWMAFHSLDFAKRYKDAELELTLELCAGSESDKLHLIFCAIPNGMSGNSSESNAANIDMSANHSGSNRLDDFMFICVTDFIQSAEEIIPSWVRLEPAKEKLDLLRYILASPSERVFQVGNASGEGESGKSGILNSRCNGDGVPSFVERTSEISHQVNGDIFKGRWERMSQLDLVHQMVNLIRVNLLNSDVGIGVLELGDFPLKIGKVFFSPRQLAP